MLGISGTELIIILFFGFLIFGPEKLPQMGRTVGRAIRQFREASDSMSKKIKTEVADPFQEAISPYKDQVENLGAPLKDDLAAINKNLQDTKRAFTNPLKESFTGSSPSKDDPIRKGTVSSAGTASAAKPEHADASADPFADVIAPKADAADRQAPSPAGEGKPLPQTKTSSIAASLYGLDDDAKGGE